MQSKLLNISLLIYCKRNIRVLSETPFFAIIKASTKSRNVASDLTKRRRAVYLLNVRKPEYRKAHHEE
jgi:ribosomal protein L36